MSDPCAEGLAGDALRVLGEKCGEPRASRLLVEQLTDQCVDHNRHTRLGEVR
eukprot:gene31015-8143_t